MEKDKRKFQLLKGGLYNESTWKDSSFISASAVNSRLMGVTGLIIERELNCQGKSRKLNLLFYFDAEEFGFDTFKEIGGRDMSYLEEFEELNLTLLSMFGGLGSDLVPIDEKEAYALVYRYAQMNWRNGEALPGDVSGYQYILDKKIELDPDEMKAFLDKICVTVESDVELINYFLMRAAGNDMLCVNYLSKTEWKSNPLKLAYGVTLYRNEVDKGNDGPGTYVCESLIDTGEAFYNIVSEVEVENLKVSGFNIVSRQQLTPVEANMILSKGFYISLFRLTAGGEELWDRLETILPGSLINIHDNAVIAIIFNPNNDHVKKPVYRLDNDVFTLVMITEAMELVLLSDKADNNKVAIEMILNGYSHDEKLPEIVHIENYHVNEPIVPIFLESDMDSFQEFITDIFIPDDSDK